MTANDALTRMSHPIYVVALLMTLVSYTGTAAGSNPTAEDDSCAVINVRTDVRPDQEGPPSQITVGIRMIDLMEISDVSQMLTGDFAVVLSWTDSRLADLVGCEVSLDHIWSPGLVFSNSGRRFRDRPKEAGIGPGGRVRYVQRYSGTFATYHDLRHFPFDPQAFRVSLFSLEWQEDEVRLVVDENVTGRREVLNVSNWTIEWVAGSIHREYFQATDRFHSRYDFTISAQRVSGYYVWKVILPLCLIVIMSWCVFWLDPDHHGPNIGLSATSMLTLIAFIFATTNMVPALSYLTRLDRFIVGSTVLVFLALVECITTINLVSRDKRDWAVRLDNVSRAVFPLVFAIIIVSAFVL
jgi:hypothetical protein